MDEQGVDEKMDREIDDRWKKQDRLDRQRKEGRKE